MGHANCACPRRAPPCARWSAPVARWFPVIANIAPVISLFGTNLFPVSLPVPIPGFCPKWSEKQHFLRKDERRRGRFSLPTGKTPAAMTAYEVLSPCEPRVPSTIFTHNGAPLRRRLAVSLSTGKRRFKARANGPRVRRAASAAHPSTSTPFSAHHSRSAFSFASAL